MKTYPIHISRASRTVRGQRVHSYALSATGELQDYSGLDVDLTWRDGGCTTAGGIAVLQPDGSYRLFIDSMPAWTPRKLAVVEGIAGDVQISSIQAA